MIVMLYHGCQPVLVRVALTIDATNLFNPFRNNNPKKINMPPWISFQRLYEFLIFKHSALPWRLIHIYILFVVSIYILIYMSIYEYNISRVKFREIFSAEHLFSNNLTFSALFSTDQRTQKIPAFFSAASELINPDFLWITAVKNWKIQRWTALFQRESALNMRCSALIVLALKYCFFSADFFWISFDINMWYENIKMW